MVDLFLIASVVLSALVGITIGGNLTFSMAAAYGCRTITRYRAIGLSAIFLFLGAYLTSGNVVEKLNSGLVFRTFNPKMSIAILVSIFICLLIGTLLKVPFSGSEIVIGSVMGAGVFYNALISRSIVSIFSLWFGFSLLAFLLSFVCSKALDRLKFSFPFDSLLLIGIGCFFSFVVGANNVANAISPILDFVSMSFALLLGGLSMVFGAVIFRGGVMKKLGNELTSINRDPAIASSLIASILLFILTMGGIPAPGAQLFTLSLMGVRQAEGQKGGRGKKTLSGILVTWVGAPIGALLLCYTALYFLFSFVTLPFKSIIYILTSFPSLTFLPYVALSIL